jgi:hypothetical protein
MLEKFGRPGALMDKCATATGDIKARIKYGIAVGLSLTFITGCSSPYQFSS